MIFIVLVSGAIGVLAWIVHFLSDPVTMQKGWPVYDEDEEEVDDDDSGDGSDEEDPGDV